MLDGVTLADRYRLNEKLGAGAMGEVWKGFDLRLNRDVAVKIFPNHLDPEPHRVERFRAEAQICGALQHAGIVVIHDADEHRGQLFFVMELLSGEDLAKVIDKAQNGLPIERVITIGARLADALAAAHAKRVIHRDIKPANIMLQPGDRPKLCDFGIARVLDPDQSKATTQVGTAAYMAPEQFDGQPDERSDLYSLGCVLYEMLTGDRPFLGNGWQLIFQHSSKTPEAPSATRAEIPAELDELILQALAKKPEDRPQTAGEVAARLKAMRTPPAPQPKLSAGAENVRQPPPQRLLKSGVPERKHTDVDDAAAKKIEAVLRKARIDAKVAGYTRAPGLTRYEIRLGPTTPAAQVLTLSAAFTAALNNTAVRLVELERSTSPLPGVAAVGVEVPHAIPDLISLGDLLRETPTEEALIIGRGRDGNPAVLDLTQSPHFLIGGDVGEIDPLHTLIASALMRRSPHQLRLALLDSRMGRLTPFWELPHVVHQEDPLAWAVAEVERRYADLSSTRCRTTDQFNREVREGRAPVPLGALGNTELVHPHVLAVVDELAEPMRLASTEKAITELTREGRAVGVHVIARTASPDEHVITSRVKAYIAARLALRVPTTEQSMRVLDHMGAESLPPGEGLLVTGRNRRPSPLRLAAISSEEIAAIVSHWRG
ncbi:DNA translocase FtsK [Planotetraspora thailandica]|uniref:DNA translocase FtsK n=1 Tax=Planotetraspora thailandica TaxID=487172 RepID=UPI0019514A40|nr:DNA translocase FtsK [Planotetraspora thailandica]